MAFKASCILLLFLQLLVPKNTIAQDCNIQIKGSVLDEHNGEKLSFASIYIKELNVGDVADEDAFYQLKNICEGTYTFVINHLECEPIYIKIKIKNDTIINFYPEHHEALLKDFVVRSMAKKTAPKNTNILSGNDLDVRQGSNLGELLKDIPGLNTLKTGSAISKPMINGLHSNRIALMNNGVKLESQQWGSEHAPEIDPFLASEIEVIKGASGIKYGPEAIGGTVLIKPAKLRDSVGLDASIFSVTSSNGKGETVSGILNGKVSKKFPLRFRLQGTLKNQGNIKTPNYYLQNTGLKESNFSTEISYKIQSAELHYFHSHFYTKIGIFTGAHIGNLTDLQTALAGNKPNTKDEFSYQINRPYQSVYHDLDKLSYNWKINDKNALEIAVSRQYNLREEYDKDKPLNDSLAALDLPDLHLEITTHNGNIHWIRTSQNWKTEIGTDITLQKNTYEGRYFIPNFTSNLIGIYVLQQYEKPRYNLAFGIRADQKHLQIYKRENNKIISPEKDFKNIAYSASGTYKINTKMNISAQLGSAWRPPQTNELYSNGLHHGAAAVEVGNDNLSLEKAWQSAMDFSYKTSKIDMNIHGYFHYIQNYIYLAPTLVPTLTIRGAFPTFHYVQTDAFYRGFDASFLYQITPNFSVSEKISVLRTNETLTKQTIINTPSDHFVTQFKYQFKNTPKMQNSNLNFQMDYTAKQWRVNPSQDYVSPPAAYFLFHLNASSEILVFKHKINIGFGVQNLFNKAYRDYLNRFRYYSDEMGRNYTLRIKIPINIK